MSQLLLLLQAALAVGIGGVFIASALPKLRHPRGFVLAVMEYRMLPMRASRAVGRVLPAAELLVGLLLVTGVWLPVAAGVATTLLLCFLAALGLNLARGRDLDCHCFGNARKRTIGWRVMLEDSALLLTAGALLGVSMVATQGGELAGWSPWRLVALTMLPAESGVVAAALLVVLVIVTALLLDPQSVLHRTLVGKPTASTQRPHGTGRYSVSGKQ